MLIHQIMTNLPNSPYLGQTVSVTGITAGNLSTGGFYITARPADYDNDPSTAEGIPIFYPAGQNPGCAGINILVTVTGVVTNTAPNAANTPGTGIMPTSCKAVDNGTSNATITLPTNATSFGQLLPFTGIPVANSTFYAISPTGGTLDEPNEIVSSNGQFWAVVSSTPILNNHLFRSAGIAPDEYTPPGAPAGIPTWSGNPRRLFIDSTTFGGPPIDIGTGQSITCVNTGPNAPGIGLIDYTLGFNRLLLFLSTRCTVSGTIAPAVAAPADALHFHVGSLNLSRFYNTLGNSAGAVAISQAAYTRRLGKAAMAINNYLGRPDILALEEVQDLATLTDIANTSNQLYGTSYAPYLAIGNDPNSLNLGFLVSTSTVIVDSLTQESKALTYSPSTGTAPLWERPPLVLNAEFIRPGENYKVSVFNIQVTPRTNVGDPTLGADVRMHRGLQALDLSRLAQQYQTSGANLLIAGNFAAYSFNDGYVDVSDIILGNPPAANAVTQYEPTDTTQPLYNFEGSVSGATKYNIIEVGNARSIEHIFVSQVGTTTAAAPLSTYAATITQPHFTTDFPAVLENDGTTAAGLTPHDGFVSSFLLPPVPTIAGVSATALDFGNVYVGASVTQTVTLTNNTTFASTVVIQSIAISGANAGDYTLTSNCTSLAQNASCTVSVTFKPSALGLRTAVLTVATNSPSTPTLLTNLTGTGVNTTATLTPTNASFPGTFPGQTPSPAVSFTFTNTSTVPLTVGTPMLTGPFTLALDACPAIVAGGASCMLSVTFSPVSAGPFPGTLTVPNSSSGNPSLVAQLSGTGLQTTASLFPTVLLFPTTIVGSTSPTQQIVFTNPNPVPLTIVSTSSSAEFPLVSTTCRGAVPANSTCTANVAFSPGGSRTRTGTFTILSNATLNPTLVASLSGTGVGDVDTDLATLNFGYVDLGTASTPLLLTLTNHTAVLVALTGIGNTGDYVYTSTCGASLSGYSSCTLAVVFRPTALGPRPGTLTITTSDNKSPVITVGLLGNGVDFAIAVAPGSGNTIAGLTVNTAVTLTPLGGFNRSVRITCTAIAPGSTCNPGVGGGAVSIATSYPYYITTTSQYTVYGYGGFASTARMWTLVLLLASTLALFASRKRTRRLAGLGGLLLALVSLALSIAGCSGQLPDRNAVPTFPGTYTYTLSATDGTLTHTATYTLTVTAK